MTADNTEFNIPEELLEKPEVPENCKNTDAYIVNNALVSSTSLETVPDLATASSRHRRWGLLFCARVVPNLDRVPEGPLVFPPVSFQFLDADSSEELLDRAIFELTVALDTAKKLKEYDAQLTEQMAQGAHDDSETATIT